MSRSAADAEVGDFGVVAFFLDGFLRDGAEGLQKPEIRNSKIEKGEESAGPSCLRVNMEADDTKWRRKVAATQEEPG